MTWSPPIGEQQLDVVARPSLHRCVGLVPVAEFVDQSGVLGLRCAVRSAVDQGTNGRFVQPPPLGDGIDGIGEHGFCEPIQRGPVGLGELGPHDLIRRVRELVPLVELRLDPEPIERAAHERGLDTDAEHADIPAGLEPHLVERRRQHIPGHRPGRLVERLGPRQCRLAARREGAHP